jgi:hypothetical protein
MTYTLRQLLRHDAGVSNNGVPANNVGGGKIDGIGVGPRPEPGGIRRRRRNRYSSNDPSIGIKYAMRRAMMPHDEELDAAFARGGDIEMMDYGSTRSTSAAKLVVDPEVPHAEERLDQIVRAGLFEHRDALVDVDAAVGDPFLHKKLGRAAAAVFSLIREDDVLYDRMKKVLRQR